MSKWIARFRIDSFQPDSHVPRQEEERLKKKSMRLCRYDLSDFEHLVDGLPSFTVRHPLDDTNTLTVIKENGEIR